MLRKIALPPPYASSKPLNIETLNLSPPQSGEVLVKIKSAGLCHSDLSVINGNRVRPVPMAIGHEAAGIVEKIGDNVRNLSVGTRVILVFVPSCGECLPCATGRPALCEPGAVANGKGELLGGGIRWKDKDGNPIYHQLGVSAFSEYVVVSQKSCIPINLTEKEISYKEMALFGCGVLTGAGAVFNTAKVSPGSSVAVVGLGGVGLSSLMAAKTAGCTNLTAIDVNPAKLELAKSLGATQTFNPTTHDATAITDATGGFEYVFEMAGSVKALELAYAITARGGTTVTAGLPPPSAQLTLQALSLVAEERTLKGSYIGSAIPKRDVIRLIELWRSGVMPVEKLLDEEVDLEGLNAAFDRLASGEAIRQVLTFSN